MPGRKCSKTRRKLAVLITRRAFSKYATFVEANQIVANVYPLLFDNRHKFKSIFTTRVRAPLLKLTENAQESKRHVISFLRRLATYYQNALVQRRKSVIIDGRPVSVYSYALIKI